MQTYETMGGYAGIYYNGYGLFNTEMTTDDESQPVSLYLSYSVPMVSDLNGDGQNEVVVLDSDGLEIYHHNATTNNLDIVDGAAWVAGVVGYTSNIEIYDIDGDGYKEIIFYVENPTLANRGVNIYRYNNSLVTKVSVDNLFDSSLSYGGEAQIKCIDTHKCIMILSSCDGQGLGGLCPAAGYTPYLWFTRFNETGNYSMGYTLLASGGASGKPYCLSNFRDMQYRDYQGPSDGINELIFTYVYATANPIVNITYVNASGSIKRSSAVSLDSTYTLQCRTNKVGSMFTSPITLNMDGQSSNGMESVFAYKTGANSFKIVGFSSTGTATYFPSSSSAGGTFLSNMMFGTAFYDGAYTRDFCVMGYRADYMKMQVLCGSYANRWGPLDAYNNVIYSYWINNATFNLTNAFGVQSSLNSMVDYSQDVNGLLDQNEIVNSYGVFRLKPAYGAGLSDCYLFDTDCEMERIFDFSNGEAVYLPVDVDKNGRTDIIVKSNTNMFYLNDGYSNQVPYFVSASTTIDPPLDKIWKINTSVYVTLRGKDPDGDAVSTRAILYYGDANQQNGSWSLNYTSDSTTVPYAFIANKTGTYSLYIAVRDNFAPDTNIYSYVTEFTVAEQGVSAGEYDPAPICTGTSCGAGASGASGTTNTTNQTIEIPSVNLLPNKNDNVVRRSLQGVDEGFGWNLGLLVMWLIVMLVGGMGSMVWVSSVASRNHMTIDPKIMLGILLILESILLFIGWQLGFISTVVIVFFVIVLLAAAALWIKQKTTQGAGSE